MDGTTNDGWKAKKMDGTIKRWMDGLKKYEWMDGWKDKRIDGWNNKDGWMNGWNDKRMK